MYTGTTHVFAPTRRDKYIHGLGTFSVPAGGAYELRHTYTCEHCGRTSQFTEAAEEPFYCHSTACMGVKLVSITSTNAS